MNIEARSRTLERTHIFPTVLHIETAACRDESLGSLTKAFEGSEKEDPGDVGLLDSQKVSIQLNDLMKTPVGSFLYYISSILKRVEVEYLDGSTTGDQW